MYTLKLLLGLSVYAALCAVALVPWGVKFTVEAIGEVKRQMGVRS